MSENDDDEKVCLLLMPISRSPAFVVSGSTVITADCGHRCWITALSLNMLESKKAHSTRCLDCQGIVEESDLSKVDICSTDEQRKELSKILGVGNVDQFYTKHKIKELP